MAEQVIKSDLDFVKGVIASGGESLKKCYQCATCSVVCKVTPDNKPFPRKEMIYAQWGLKDRLINNPDIWLCHQCSDCTAYCPRGAKPGEVLGAIRKLSIQHYAFPQFLGKAVAEAKYLPLLFAVPIILFLAILASLGNLRIPEGEIVFAKFMPVLYIDAIFIPVASFAALAFAIGILRFWKDMNINPWRMKLKGALPPTIISTIGEILLHKRFNKCELTKARSSSHLYVFYGFVGLAITTTWAIYYLYGLNWESPYPLTDPLKMLGNFSGILLLLGITLVVTNRFKNKEKADI
ncbi:MAG: quinone-interacting membrane-bound oxidoreductase complex subunit QmoC, partial [Nitrospirota bacterium]